MTKKEQQAYDKARREILAAVKRTRAGKPVTVINFSRRGLVALPPEIGQLTALPKLNLDNNQLTSLPPEIGQLVALTTLSLNSNQLTALPPEIGQLNALAALEIHSNQLTTLPQEIGRLKALMWLNLHRNPLTELPPEFKQLTKLEVLALSGTQQTVVPPVVWQLSALTTLYLYDNRLRTLPPEVGQLTALRELYLNTNQLTTLPSQIRKLKALKRLFLHGNPNLNLPLSVLGPTFLEVDRDGVVPSSPHAILDYYFGRLAKGSRPLNEVKVILVGRGAAGKTSTVRALRGLDFDATEQSTLGIALCDWKMEGVPGEPVTAHLWDFAGQVITHALHQFFFSTRSVYVLVLTGRENSEREDAEYWLRLIRAFGTDEEGNGPPVLVALNNWDEPGCRPRLDRTVLEERYPFIRGFVEMDCKTKRGIPELGVKLCQEVGVLKWVRDPIKPEWDEVRQTLTDTRTEDGPRRPHISFNDFRHLCAEKGITDTAEQDSLAEILHNLGIALNYRNDPRLREATVLLPHWLTENVYALVRRAEDKNGVLTAADVNAALQEEPDEAMRRYLVRIMERFEIAYAAKDDEDSLRLVPQALPDQQPKGMQVFRDAPEATRLRYTYTALPEGLVPRAIVRLHEFIVEENSKKLQWASGAVLERNGARALLRREPEERMVTLTVMGPEDERRALAGLCRSEMRDIHRDIEGLNPVEETRYEGTWVPVPTLENDEQHHRQTGVATLDKGTLSVDPAQLNNAYSTAPARDPGVWKPRAFICYSKDNIRQRDSLVRELKVLRNEGLLAGAWHDRMIGAGEDWDEAIQRQMEEVDIIIILCTAAALATDYIWDHEFPKAFAVREARGTVVIPVILEPCRWQETDLRKLNALPEKGRPLEEYKTRAKGWSFVANGLAEVCKKLQQVHNVKPR